jgi:hypothetical protein
MYKRTWTENPMKQNCKLRKKNLGLEWLAIQSEADAIPREDMQLNSVQDNVDRESDEEKVLS